MSNRRKTRDLPPPAWVVRTATKMQCPDCDSDVTMRQADGQWRISIAHDDECPQYQWRERNDMQTSYGLTMEDGSPLTAEVMEKIIGEIPKPALITLGAAAPSWQVREVVDQLREEDQ